MSKAIFDNKILYYLDLGENTYTPKQRNLYFWGGLIVAAFCTLALIMAVRKGEALFFEILNPLLFAIIALWFGIESRKARLYPHGQFFVSLGEEGIEFRSPAQKKTERILFQNIKEVKRYWDKITIKVEGSPFYYIHTMDKKRAKELLIKINEQIALKTPLNTL